MDKSDKSIFGKKSKSACDIKENCFKKIFNILKYKEIKRKVSKCKGKVEGKKLFSSAIEKFLNELSKAIVKFIDKKFNGKTTKKSFNATNFKNKS